MLIVYAHQSSGSFNAAAKDAAVEVLTAQGCTVEVSDLYAMKFKAAATAEDVTGELTSSWHKPLVCYCDQQQTFLLSLGEVKNAEHFRYAEETKLALEAGKLSEDITKEQSKITEADLIIFQVELEAALMSSNHSCIKLN